MFAVLVSWGSDTDSKVLASLALLLSSIFGVV